jgi:hypothetical protein
MNKGISLYIAVVIMAVLLSVVFGLSGLILTYLKTMGEAENSVPAFYAADSGIEEVLMSRANPSSSCQKTSPCLLDNEAGYYIEIITGGSGNCSADNYCIRSVGSYKGVSRAIEISY